MQIKKRCLGVCCVGRRELDYLLPLFSRYFDSYLKIVPMEMGYLDEIEEVPEVIMVTYITGEAVQRQFPGSKVIFMRRFLTGHNLESVIQLSEGTSALVVNWPESAAHEVVRELEEKGIHHINMTPYWPGLDIKVNNYDVIIYTGSDYYPEGNFQYIDLGHRTVAISTLIEIIKAFDLPSSCGEQFYFDNMEQILQGSFRLNQLLRTTRQMKDNLENVCEQNRNAFFTYDSGKKISYFNPAASNLFKKTRQEAIGKPVQSVLQGCGCLLNLLLTKEKLTEMLVSIRGSEALVTTSSYDGEDGSNTLVNIVLLEELQRATSHARNKLKVREFIAKYHFDNILGSSPEIQHAIKMARIYAHSEAAVLITGESGVGKELFAQSIHNASSRSNHPFVAINFAALPESLAESELFGYNEGAFTGALRGGKQGLFELAHQGTIFLDEIGDAPLALQAKLLRVLEEREIVRVGGANVISIDIRIICATNKDLKKMIHDGRFREDLYYRIKTLSIHIPALRERRSDIAPIMRQMLQDPDVSALLDPEIMDMLVQYSWPGNIRELKGVVEYMSTLWDVCRRGENDYGSVHRILTEFLQDSLFHAAENTALPNPPSPPQHTAVEIGPGLCEILMAIEEMKRMNMIVGRGSLARLTQIQEAGLSESKLKTRLKYLREMELIKVGTTKQGMTLTEQGRKVLENCKCQNKS